MPNPFISVINSFLSEPQASLLNGILFGTKVNMPNSFYRALTTTGTLHVIALSGINISIIINLIAKITLFMGRKLSCLLTIVLIVSFVVFVGASPSIVRAAIMGSMSLLAVFFGRRDWGLLSLFLSGGIMLLFDLSLMKNISFQLSFLATFGIILANRKGERQQDKSSLRQIIHWFKENLKLTLVAQLFTLPVILYNFRRISLIAPMANIATEWVIQPIMVLGFVTAISGYLWWPLGLIPSWVVWVPLTYFITITEWLAEIPGASINF
jgi:competence protein ComEC